jgi:hypothetical protein
MNLSPAEGEIPPVGSDQPNDLAVGEAEQNVKSASVTFANSVMADSVSESASVSASASGSISASASVGGRTSISASADILMSQPIDEITVDGERKNYEPSPRLDLNSLAGTEVAENVNTAKSASADQETQAPSESMKIVSFKSEALDNPQVAIKKVGASFRMQTIKGDYYVASGSRSYSQKVFSANEESEDELTIQSGFPSEKPPMSTRRLDGEESVYLADTASARREIDYVMPPGAVSSSGEEVKSLRRLAQKDMEQRAALGTSHLSTLLETDRPRSSSERIIAFAHGRPESSAAGDESIALTYSPPKKEIIMVEKGNKGHFNDSALTSRAQSPKFGTRIDVIQAVGNPAPNTSSSVSPIVYDLDDEFQSAKPILRKTVFRKRATHKFLKAGERTKGGGGLAVTSQRNQQQVAYAPPAVGGFSADANW